MQTAKKIFLRVRDVVEIGVPCASFCLMFLVFILQIVSRYVFNRPISWTTEIQVLGYIWLVLTGAGYVMRMKRHVSFTVFYDAFDAKVQRIMRVAGNLLLSVTYLILLPFTVRYVLSETGSSAFFRIPRVWYFLPMILFVFTTICYSLYDVYRDVRDMMEGKPPVDHRLVQYALHEGEEEAE